jgi:hypothetical protein
MSFGQNLVISTIVVEWKAEGCMTAAEDPQGTLLMMVVVAAAAARREGYIPWRRAKAPIKTFRILQSASRGNKNLLSVYFLVGLGGCRV